MNAELITVLARDEIIRAKKPYLEWPSLIKKIPPRKDRKRAIKYLSSLSEDELESRLAIFHWEDAAMARYIELVDSGSILLNRSIDAREWAGLEIANINLVLRKGIDELMTPCEYFRWPDEFPGLYAKLVSGYWQEFISFEELKRDRLAEFESLYDWIIKWSLWTDPLTDEDKRKLHKVIRKNWEYIPFSEQIRRKKQLPDGWFSEAGSYSKEELTQCLTAVLIHEEESNENDPYLYQRKETTEAEEADYDEDRDFNKTWYLARDIQALVWYRNYLRKVEEEGVDFSDEIEALVQDKYDIRYPEDTDETSDAMIESFKLYMPRFKRFPKYTVSAQ
jgi:hypothetical protein